MKCHYALAEEINYHHPSLAFQSTTLTVDKQINPSKAWLILMVKLLLYTFAPVMG
jgi:hypothetical protein